MGYLDKERRFFNELVKFFDRLSSEDITVDDVRAFIGDMPLYEAYQAHLEAIRSASEAIRRAYQERRYGLY